MKGNLTVSFADGSTHAVELEEALVLQLPGSEEIGFRKGRDGKTRLVVTTGLLKGRRLASQFLTASKQEPDTLQAYTVLLLYPDYLADTFGHDTFMTTVEATSVQNAIKEAQREACDSNEMPEYKADNFHVLAVMLGSHADIKDD